MKTQVTITMANLTPDDRDVYVRACVCVYMCMHVLTIYRCLYCTHGKS